jgi:hypothetical protein
MLTTFIKIIQHAQSAALTQKSVLIYSFILLAPFFANAQRMDDGKIDELKTAFFTEKLALSPSEAKIFWPIYNDFNREQSALRKQRKKTISFRKTNEIDNLSDAEIQTLILNDFDFKQKELYVEKKYYNKLKASLPIKVVGKFYRAQEAFKRELLMRFRNSQRK